VTGIRLLIVAVSRSAIGTVDVDKKRPLMADAERLDAAEDAAYGALQT
jgi:hypothetical protein